MFFSTITIFRRAIFNADDSGTQDKCSFMQMLFKALLIRVEQMMI